MDAVLSPAGYEIARIKNDDLIFNDPRLVEALEHLLKGGSSVLLSPRDDGKIIVRISRGQEEDKVIGDLFDHVTSEYGVDKSLLRALRYAMAYHYGGDDDFPGAVDTAHGRWNAYALEMHLVCLWRLHGHEQAVTSNGLSDLVTLHDHLHEQGAKHSHQREWR